MLEKSGDKYRFALQIMSWLPIVTYLVTCLVTTQTIGITMFFQKGN